MGNLFGGSKPAPIAAPPAELPPPPARTDQQTQDMEAEQRKRFTNAGSAGSTSKGYSSLSGSGRASTFLSGAGLDTGSSAVRFLGGAAKT